MSKNSRAVQALYTTAAGRAVLKVLQACGASRLAAAFLHSSLSRPLIRRYISRYDIPMEEFEGVRFPSFGAFFARKKKSVQFDAAPDHLISPCDGWLSVYPIEADSSFAIKGSRLPGSVTCSRTPAGRVGMTAGSAWSSACAPPIITITVISTTDTWEKTISLRVSCTVYSPLPVRLIRFTL